MNFLEENIDKVLCMDAVECMRLIPDKTVDLICTDPPYSISDKGGSKKVKNYSIFRNDWDKDFNPLPFLDEAFRIIKDNGQIIVMCNRSLLGTYLRYRKEQDILHWYHPTRVPAFSKVFAPTIEYAVWWTNPDYTFNKKYAKTNVFDYLRPYQLNQKYPHPSQKPTHLIKKWIQVLTNPGDMVIDFFVGSGTTAIAALEMDRHFIVNDISPEYAEMTKKRVALHHKKIYYFSPCKTSAL
jgi:site-specific DNA-methyltransferase (adenine-specific)